VEEINLNREQSCPYFVEIWKKFGGKGGDSGMALYSAALAPDFYYRLISTWLSAHPSYHLISVGVVTAALVTLLFVNQAWLKRLPLYGYMGAVLACLVLLHLITRTIPMLAVYVIVLGYVQFRSTAEKPYLMAAVYYAAYVLVQWLTFWQPFMLVEWASDSLLFGWVTFLCQEVKHTVFEWQKAQNKNKFLVRKKQEYHQLLVEKDKEVEERYRRDSLTGLYNFGGFQEQVMRSLIRCAPHMQYHVICFDLVDFREINMNQGIQVGDQILCKLAFLLKKHLPPYTLLARYDGDQFAIGVMGDQTVLRRVLDAVEKVMEELKEHYGLLFQYCQGSASYPQDGESAAELIRLAEHRLYLEQRRLRDKEEEHRRHLEKLSAVGQLAAGLAHEIRNPLTSIRGFIQISAAESEAVKKWESIILPEIDRINDLLKQFLKLSESRPVKVSRFSLDQLMRDVASLLEPKALLLGHELVMVSPGEEVELEADAEQIKQVLINLIQNGFEALPDKGTVQVRWQVEENRVHIEVEDNGNGIKPEHLSRVFEPFFTTKDEGTGMGLSVCYQIITQHGGQIHVTSTPGRGTVFHIHLPLAQPVRKVKKLLQERKNRREKMAAAVRHFAQVAESAVK
jgi:diguanylate cyclase (GGDEF)-like protein